MQQIGCYLLQGMYTSLLGVTPWFRSLKFHRVICRAFEPKSGRYLEVHTNQPGVQFYTGNFLKDIDGKGNVTYNEQSAFCFETQAFPNSVNLVSYYIQFNRKTYVEKPEVLELFFVIRIHSQIQCSNQDVNTFIEPGSHLAYSA